MILNVSEKQFLIAIQNLIFRNELITLLKIEDFGKMFFCSYKRSFNDAFFSLLEKSVIFQDNEKIYINLKYQDMVTELVEKHPRFRYWYNEWYQFGNKSRAHSTLCQDAYGIDLHQTGMLTLNQINYLLNNVLQSQKKCLDLGCGSGYITEYLADNGSLEAVGIDIIANGIRNARLRTREKPYLRFYLYDMRTFYINEMFDYIMSFDTIYFIGKNIPQFITNCQKMKKDEGKIIIFYSAFRPKDSSLDVHKTLLGSYLNQEKIKYQFVDFTADDYTFWKKKHQKLTELELDFLNENNKIIYDNLLIEATHYVALANNKEMRRYLYII